MSLETFLLNCVRDCVGPAASFKFGDPRLPQRFWKKVEPEPNTGCWLWTGNLKPAGYGNWDRNSYAHRAAYCALMGPIPDGLELDHVCRTPACCNPLHLEAVPHSLNVRRGTSIVAQWAARKVCHKCGSGLVPAIRHRNGREVPYRACMPCRKKMRRAYRERTGK